MTIDDLTAKSEAEKLEKSLECGDMTALHNQLVELARDQDSFSKIMSTFDEINQQRRDQALKNGINLPDVEIHKDGLLGFGNVDQVVVNGLGQNHDQKMEVFESAGHRQAEETENAKQSEPLHLDLGRWLAKMNLGHWQGGQPDFQTDSSVPWQNDAQQSAADKVKDYRGDHRVGALEDPNAMRMSEEELEKYLKGGR